MGDTPKRDVDWSDPAQVALHIIAERCSENTNAARDMLLDIPDPEGNTEAAAMALLLIYGPEGSKKDAWDSDALWAQSIEDGAPVTEVRPRIMGMIAAIDGLAGVIPDVADLEELGTEQTWAIIFAYRELIQIGSIHDDEVLEDVADHLEALLEAGL